MIRKPKPIYDTVPFNKKEGHMKGGKVKKSKFKASTALQVASGASAIGAAGATAGVISAPLAVPLGVFSGIAGGASTILKAFGAGMSKDELNAVQGIHDRHMHYSRGNPVGRGQLNTDIKTLKSISKKHEKKGGKIKPSEILTGLSGASAIGAAVAGGTGVGAPAALPLALFSGVSGGASKILSAFGAGLSKSDHSRVTSIHKRHIAKIAGVQNVSHAQTLKDQKYLNSVASKMSKKSGGSMSVGGSVSTGGALKDIPKKFYNFVTSHPQESILIAKLALKALNSYYGGAITKEGLKTSATQLGKTLATAGATLAGTALATGVGLKVYFLAHPEVAQKVAQGIVGFGVGYSLGGKLNKQSMRNHFQLPGLGRVGVEHVGKIIGGVLKHPEIPNGAKTFVMNHPASAIRIAHNLHGKVEGGSLLPMVTENAILLGSKGLYGLGKSIMHASGRLRSSAEEMKGGKISKGDAEAGAKVLKNFLIKYPTVVSRIRANVNKFAIGAGVPTGGSLPTGGQASRRFALKGVGRVPIDKAHNIIKDSIGGHDDFKGEAKQFAQDHPTDAIKMAHNIDQHLKKGGSLKTIAGIGLLGLAALGGTGAIQTALQDGNVQHAIGNAVVSSGIAAGGAKLLVDASKSKKKKKGGGVGSKILAGLSVAGLSAGAGAMAFKEYLVRNPTQIAKLGIEAGRYALGGSIKTGGSISVGGGSRVSTRGTKEQVWKGLAVMTSGGLKKSDLMINPKTNKIISKKKHALGKKLVTEGKLKPYTAGMGKG